MPVERILLENFKASRNVEVRLSALTVLTGLNGSGKSSLLQALGVLRQSYDEQGSTQGLLLDGQLVHLGQGRDVLNEGGDDDIIKIAVVEDGLEYVWRCRSIADADILPFDAVPNPLPACITVSNFQYLQADRIVPMTHYHNAPQYARKMGFLGTRGEFAIDFLARNENQPVSEIRRCPTTGYGVNEQLISIIAPTNKLIDQVAGWMQQISPGVSLNTEFLPGTDEVRLKYRYAGQARDVSSNSYRPTHVGFGITYCLPIIIACLSAQNGALLMLENPEAHLHPQGQAALGEMLARCAADGVQILVETHSDHVMNGIRLAAKRKLISCDDVAIHFFSRPVSEGQVYVQSPSLLEDGRLSNWPEGFFDQWDKSIDAIIAG